MALALLAALAGIVMPLMLERTRDLSFDDMVLQLEQAAAVARAESQRESRAVLFEVRWSAREGVYRVGTARMGEQGESEGAANIVSELPRFDGKEGGLGESHADLPSFQAILTLPAHYEIRRRIPEEYFEPQVGSGGARSSASGSPEEDAVGDAWAPVEEWGDPQRPQRVIIAVFLPDGTLIGEDRLYLIGPGQRVASIRTSRWLGMVKVERVRLQRPTDGREGGEESSDAPGVPEVRPPVSEPSQRQGEGGLP